MLILQIALLSPNFIDYMDFMGWTIYHSCIEAKSE